MQKILICTFLAFAGMKAGAQSTVPPNEVDKIALLNPVDYDMGRIPAGKPLEYNVTIRNIGKDTLLLREVKAGCGCTTPKYRTNEVILPGKSTYITLGFNGDAHGDFSKFADVFFNDGTATKKLSFHGTTYTDSTQKPVSINR